MKLPSGTRVGISAQNNDVEKKAEEESNQEVKGQNFQSADMLEQPMNDSFMVIDEVQQEQLSQRTAVHNRATNDADMCELQQILKLIWGDNIDAYVFENWSQGFLFSQLEPSALVQIQGGPCAVLAPVQAYIIKFMLTELTGQDVRQLATEQCYLFLVKALCNILHNCRAARYRMVKFQLPNELQMLQTEAAADANADDSNSLFITAAEFHNNLQITTFDCIRDVERYYVTNLEDLSNKYAVLLFLYTVFLTKGARALSEDHTDTTEPLIHNIYGYGAQPLINLMLTGRAVAEVFDNEQIVGGLRLQGISEPNDIGFITLMEQMDYCTVGSHFKNPRYPIWVLASDTHLTVLFSSDVSLVTMERPSEVARRVFKSYDTEGHNFISLTSLQDVLESLNFLCDTIYLDVMKMRLDPKNSGVVFLDTFMNELFPKECPDLFDLIHYNGIPSSNMDNTVRYYRGTGILVEDEAMERFAQYPLLACLRVKWPNLVVDWSDIFIPSLN